MLGWVTSAVSVVRHRHPIVVLGKPRLEPIQPIHWGQVDSELAEEIVNEVKRVD